MTFFYLASSKKTKAGEIENQTFECEDCLAHKLDKRRNCSGNIFNESFKYYIHPKIPSTKINMCPKAYFEINGGEFSEWLIGIFMDHKIMKVPVISGGLKNYPCWLVDAFRCIQGAISRYEKLEE